MIDSLPQAHAITLMSLNKSNAENTVFCLHTSGGGIGFYRGLAESIADKAKCYGLDDPALHGDFTYRRLEELALFHCRTIKSTQKQGPYWLFGYCSGGPLAFETANQLTLKGEHINGVVLFGEHVAGFEKVETKYQFLEEYLENRFGLHLPHVDWRSLEKLSVDDVVSTVSDGISKSQMEGIEMRSNWIRRALRALILNRLACQIYSPVKGKFNIDIYERTLSEEVAKSIHPWCDWKQLTQGQIRWFAAPPLQEKHNDILFEPYLKSTSEKVKSITLALAQHSASVFTLSPESRIDESSSDTQSRE